MLMLSLLIYDNFRFRCARYLGLCLYSFLVSAYCLTRNYRPNIICNPMLMRRKSESEENSLIRTDPIRIEYNEIRSDPIRIAQIKYESDPNPIGSDRIGFGFGSDWVRIGFAHLYFRSQRAPCTPFIVI